MMETEHLLLRPFADEDTDAVFAYRSLEEVARYQYWEPYTQERAAEFVRECARIGFGSREEWTGLVVVNKQNGQVIGDCALNVEGNAGEIGCSIAPAFQKQGFARETLQALIRCCFEQFGVDEVYGITDAENTASIRLMESVGMRRDAAFERVVPCKGIQSTEWRYVTNRTI